MRPASAPAPLRAREREALRRARWTVVSQVPGRLRVRNALLPRYAVLPLRIASALARLPGVIRFSISLPTSKVLIRYRQDLLTPGEIVRLLSRLLAEAAEEPALARLDVWQRGMSRAWLQVSLSSANLVLAAASLAAPPLAPAALVLGLLASGHILARAVWALLVERRLRVDVLDAAAILFLLRDRRVIPAGLLVLIVDLGNVLLEATSRSSREILSRVFEQRPATAWRLVDGQEIETAAADLRAGDLVVARAGDPIPADGTVVVGEATVDQRILTGESTAAERSVGDFVFAMTTVLTGELTVLVRQAGAETNAAKIVAIIEESVRHKTRLQSQGERFAERMVLPTLGLGAVGFATAGADSMVAILNADYGTGIRVAAPLSLLSAISIAARRGVLVKDGGALEAVREIDTVVFDKTGTLT
ncbi:MAG TPA: HAD-IC family P-type ATPase, partial [Thermoanaerobaculia bacterium]|nr:HAD-IC family P-type ATPase [Thermoanaerobaculia bacterium]